MDIESHNIPQVRPNIRIFARMADYFFLEVVIYSLTLFFVSLLTLDDVFNSSFIVMVVLSSFFIGYICFILWIFVESFFLWGLGTTPGKWLFSIKIRDEKGDKLSFHAALVRSFRVWFRGLALNIPIVYLITAGIAYDRLKKRGITSWDQDGRIKVIHEKIGAIKIILIILFVIMVIIAGVLLKFMEQEITDSKINSLVNEAKSAIYVETLQSRELLYHLFTDQTNLRNVKITLASDLPLELYAIPSDADYHYFAANEPYNSYPGCSFANQTFYTLECQVSTGGIIVYNPNLGAAIYNIKIEAKR